MTPLAAPFLAGVALGLASAAHCVGMCGAFAARAAAAPRRVAGFGAYAAGKTFSYLVIGAAAGAAGGRVLRDAGAVQAWVAAAAAATLVAVGVARLLPASTFRLLPERAARAIAAPVRGLARASLPGGRFTLGALNGLLPCGVVYLAALQAAALGTPLRAVALMAGFGVGTIPALVGAGVAADALRRRV
ncbi:MAG TPA: sulfite exporter TauE/SafE family protein, partial [Planctomycetota bacterium]|nr:sulfite exporter TauE/SafE family protein [Planctomycetota bacterium]